MNCIYIDNYLVKRSLASSLTAHLDKHLNFRQTEQVLDAYKIGSITDDGAVFWRLRADGQPVGGAVAVYDEQGELKQWDDITQHIGNHVSSRYYAAPCLFGMHLVGDKPIIIVPNELTALIGAGKQPQFTWLGVGHGQNLTDELLTQLTGHQVVLFPDSLCSEPWRELKLHYNMALNESFINSDIIEYLDNIN